MAGMVIVEVFVLFFIHAVFCLTFAPDSDNVKAGETVKLVCDVTIPAFTAAVTLSKDNVQKTSCDNANICTPYSSDSGRYQYSSNSSAVTVQISSLQASDDGTWTCRVGTSQPVFYLFKISSTTSPDNEEQINSACGSFHCGFWLLWLVIVTSIIILFLMWKKVKRFGFSASGCSNMKIGITVVFSVVAIGTGLGLGLGLREGQANCLECGATIGISIALGVALSVIEFIVIIKCDKEKVSVFRAVINITSESYTDNLKDCTSRAYKDLSRRVTKAIESLYKNVTGQQTVVDLKFSPGLKVTFDLSSQGFDDCSVLSGTLNNALQSGLISPFKVNSVGFEFMPLQDWKDSKG